MKILKIVGIVILAIIVVLLGAILMQPADGHIEKSIVINAPASAIFPHINTFKTFKSWSPWAKMDPEAVYTFTGPEEGVGAKMSWDGKKTGKGSQWIIESEENRRVKSGLSFDGYNGTPLAEFVLTPEGQGTKVSWTYDGPNSGMGGKAMWLVMKGMLEGQYDEGLTSLKQLVEADPAK